MTPFDLLGQRVKIKMVPGVVETEYRRPKGERYVTILGVQFFSSAGHPVARFIFSAQEVIRSNLYGWTLAEEIELANQIVWFKNKKPSETEKLQYITPSCIDGYTSLGMNVGQYRHLLESMVEKCVQHIQDRGIQNQEDLINETIWGVCHGMVGEKLQFDHVLWELSELPEHFLKLIFTYSSQAEKIFNHLRRNESFQHFLWKCLLTDVASKLKAQLPEINIKLETFWK